LGDALAAWHVVHPVAIPVWFITPGFIAVPVWQSVHAWLVGI
jgi:hypothetical protein